MSLYSNFRTDPDLESGRGIRIDLGVEERVWIHRAGGANKNFQKAMQRLFRPYQRQVSNGTMDEEVARKIMMEAYAEAVLVRWEGITDERGNPMEFNKQNAMKLFSDLPEVFSIIREEAEKVANFRSEQIQADVGNSPNASNGTWNGVPHS